MSNYKIIARYPQEHPYKAGKQYKKWVYLNGIDFDRYGKKIYNRFQAPIKVSWSRDEPYFKFELEFYRMDMCGCWNRIGNCFERIIDDEIIGESSI